MSREDTIELARAILGGFAVMAIWGFAAYLP